MTPTYGPARAEPVAGNCRAPLWYTSHMLFLTTCAGCNAPGDTLCRRCRFALVSSSTVVTEHGVHAAMPFDGVGRSIVHGLKFRNRRGVARQLAALMVRRLVPSSSYDVV